MLTIKSFTFSPVQENTYVVYNEDLDAILIDPGCYFEEEKTTLYKFIESNKLKVIQLVNTHCHLDHVFGNAWAADRFDLELYIHANEEKVLAFATKSGEMYGLPFKNYNGSLHYLHEGKSLNLGKDELKILLAPGHSPGSLCFYCEKQRFVIGGDVLFRESIGRTDLPGGDHDTLLKSIREQLFTLPEDVVVYSGHGLSTTIGYEKTHNPFLT